MAQACSGGRLGAYPWGEGRGEGFQKSTAKLLSAYTDSLAPVFGAGWHSCPGTDNWQKKGQALCVMSWESVGGLSKLGASNQPFIQNLTSSRAEGLLFLHGLESNPGSSLHMGFAKQEYWSRAPSPSL